MGKSGDDGGNLRSDTESGRESQVKQRATCDPRDLGGGSDVADNRRPEGGLCEPQFSTFGRVVMQPLLFGAFIVERLSFIESDTP